MIVPVCIFFNALFDRFVCNVKILGNRFDSHFDFIIYTKCFSSAIMWSWDDNAYNAFHDENRCKAALQKM